MLCPVVELSYDQFFVHKLRRATLLRTALPAFEHGQRQLHRSIGVLGNGNAQEVLVGNLLIGISANAYGKFPKKIMLVIHLCHSFCTRYYSQVKNTPRPFLGFLFFPFMIHFLNLFICLFFS